MLLVSDLRVDIEGAKSRLGKKNFKEIELIDKAISLDDERKASQTKRDALLAQRNEWSKKVGEFYKQGDKVGGDALKEQINTLKDAISAEEDHLNTVSQQLEEVLVHLPNMPHESVPAGHTAEDNEVVFTVKNVPELDDQALPHWELAKKYDLIDFESGAKISGAGFVLFKGKGAMLQRALINFFLDEAISAGYQEIVPPLLVNETSAFGTGSLPDKEGQMYYVTEDDLYLIPTAEVPITNIHRDEILEEKDLPIKFAGYTPCFRREAGSYGSHVRGLNRVHQFDKVEIVQVAHPERSYEVLDEMVKHVETLLKKLELPYRILRLCGGDMSFTSALTYDFEVYSAAQKRWLEVSSVSNFESFQTNRLKLRFKDENNNKHLCHTLNGSALALARIIACLLENNQTEDGIRIPEVLRSYMRCDLI
ncbi:MAG: serine--tRNA ligase [Chitinophagales bacterium]